MKIFSLLITLATLHITTNNNHNNRNLWISWNNCRTNKYFIIGLNFFIIIHVRIDLWGEKVCRGSDSDKCVYDCLIIFQFNFNWWRSSLHNYYFWLILFFFSMNFNHKSWKFIMMTCEDTCRKKVLCCWTWEFGILFGMNLLFCKK